MIVDHNKFRLFDYINNPSKDDEFILGGVVYKESENAIGVIIQCHGNNEYRTDKFGNCCFDEKYGNIEEAKLDKIKELRPELLS